MGLDMYLRGEQYVSEYDHSQQAPEGGSLRVERPKIDGFDICEYVLDMGQWRKFAPLHEYIVDEFAGGEDNCQRIHFEPEDLRKIANALRHDKLPANEDCGGFFFGSPEGWQEERTERAWDHAQKFEKAAFWIEQKTWRSVYYQASW